MLSLATAHNLEGELEESVARSRQAVEASAALPSAHNRALGHLCLFLTHSARSDEEVDQALSLLTAYPRAGRSVARGPRERCHNTRVSVARGGRPERAYPDRLHGTEAVRAGLSTPLATCASTTWPVQSTCSGFGTTPSSTATSRRPRPRTPGVPGRPPRGISTHALVPLARGDLEAAAARLRKQQRLLLLRLAHAQPWWPLRPSKRHLSWHGGTHEPL